MDSKELVKRLFEKGMLTRRFEFDENVQKNKNFTVSILKTININDNNYMILNIRSGRYQILAVKNEYGIISTYKHSLRDCINWIKLFSAMDDIITNSYVELMNCKFDDYVDSKELPNTIELNFNSDSEKVKEILLKNRIASNSYFGLKPYNLFKEFGDIERLKKIKALNDTIMYGK